ncbi:MAG: energy transducer TonB [Pseudomonadales bacterium]|jgi:protein TonB|nr:energy transducer TonB [Pseudomonadales bacterium]
MILRFLRYPIGIAFGLALTSVMFWTMWSLTSERPEVDKLEVRRIEFTRMVRDTQTETRRVEKVERTPPPVTPDMPQMSLSNTSGATTVVSLAPTVDVGSAIGKIGINAAANRDPVPLVRIQPDYPQRALSRNIEGWVQVQFTITETGSVADAKVVASDPPNMFDDAAIKAILRWRYNPMIEDGTPVARPGMQTILRFNLDGK